MTLLANQERKKNITKYLNRFYPNVLSTLICSYDYYYDDDDCFKMTPCELDIKRLFFKPINNNNDSPLLISFPSYLYNYDLPITEENLEKKGRQVVFITQPIKITNGGIPRHNYRWFANGPDDNKRAYFYIPKNDDSKELFDCIQKIDDYMHYEINIKHNINNIINILQNGKRKGIKGITYEPMITTAKLNNPYGDINDEDDDEYTINKNFKNYGKLPEWDRIKVKFSTVYDAHLEYNDSKVNTLIFIGDKLEPEPCSTVSQIEKYFKWSCTAQFALMFSKLWVSKSNKICSISIKCVQLCVTQLVKKETYTEQYKKSLFTISNTGIGKLNPKQTV